MVRKPNLPGSILRASEGVVTLCTLPLGDALRAVEALIPGYGACGASEARDDIAARRPWRAHLAGAGCKRRVDANRRVGGDVSIEHDVGGLRGEVTVRAVLIYGELFANSQLVSMPVSYQV